MSLLVRATHQAEMVIKQEVTLEPQELGSHLAFAIARNLADSHLRVVIADSNRNSTEEFEPPTAECTPPAGDACDLPETIPNIHAETPACGMAALLERVLCY